jgi:hypothetical protein
LAGALILHVEANCKEDSMTRWAGYRCVAGRLNSSFTPFSPFAT